eukprot:CAMPEP_0198224624 /NCGR_PEP_ID=MMETSP1445-20131203/97694_1 /TAXON_ID=36898 /ORGANISM="Pyramimonas sp., Strain CCMP2087" /LENGTH=236 /DNA_ID=CAMNT_0043903853 /DNA_START=434 /DNA_END=1141 /DNA_ORIENTATION=+
MSEHKRLVRLIARAFYSGECPPKLTTAPGGGRSRMDKIDRRGMAVLIIDTLTRMQWVKEEDLAARLKLHSKQLRRTLRFLEQELMVRREHRREKPPPRPNLPEIDEASRRPHTYSYACIDYTRAIDMTRLRLYHMRKKLEDHVQEKAVEQMFVCGTCNRKYSSMDAAYLAMNLWHCEDCRVEVQREVGNTGTAGDDEAIMHHKTAMRDLLKRLDIQITPIKEALIKIRDVPAPNYG